MPVDTLRGGRGGDVRGHHAAPGGMGVPFEIEPEVGPIVHQPMRDKAEAVAAPAGGRGRGGHPLRDGRPSACSAATWAGRAALIGFSGAPFTLASLHDRGPPLREYAQAKGMMYGDEETWHALMEKVTDQVIRYLQAQVRAGAQVVQLFDSWVGILSPRTTRRYSLPYSRRVFEALQAAGVPRIHFGTGTARLLELMAGGRPGRGQRRLAGAPGRRPGADRRRQGHPGQPGPVLCPGPGPASRWWSGRPSGAAAPGAATATSSTWATASSRTPTRRPPGPPGRARPPRAPRGPPLPTPDDGATFAPGATPAVQPGADPPGRAADDLRLGRHRRGGAGLPAQRARRAATPTRSWWPSSSAATG